MGFNNRDHNQLSRLLSSISSLPTVFKVGIMLKTELASFASATGGDEERTLEPLFEVPLTTAF
jgi:hypothetical protein